MPQRAYKGKSPLIAGNAYIDPTAAIYGDVILESDVSIWPHVSIRGDVQSIRISARSNVQDGTVIHVTHDSSTVPGGRSAIIGEEVTIGHRVILHGCHIASRCLIGMGSIILDGAKLEEWVMVAAGSLVPPDRILTSGYLWMGSPAKAVRPLTEEEKAFIPYSAQHYVRVKDGYLGVG